MKRAILWLMAAGLCGAQIVVNGGGAEAVLAPPPTRG